ncbi:MAG: hypothetical protein KGL39_14720 [Patescibacteria group bacterium]|nr:hypothetical protein [Patescibacteria group bacterium]
MKRLPKVDITPIQMHENRWYRLDSPEITECCDCGLVHHTEYMLSKGRLFWRSVVDRKATRAARARDGIKIVRAKRGAAI